MSQQIKFSSSFLPDRTAVIIIAAILLVDLYAMISIPLMDVDAAQYATISMEMLQNDSYLEIHHRGEDYLDKPPLVFWTAALSYTVFGMNHFAYRLPSFLFVLLGAWSVFRLGSRIYDRETGKLAAIVMLASLSYSIMVHDVRTDTMVTSAILFAIWQLYLYLEDRKILNFLGGFTGIALALLAKGPIGIMVPVMVLAPQLIWKRDWRNLFRPEWLLGILLILVLLFPMTLGLYRQFGWDGIEFFYWTQSFGRITGQNVWKDDSDFFFLFHNFLWMFIPWMVLAYYGLGRDLMRLFRGGEFAGKLKSLIPASGFLLVMLSMSTSQFKLPHYIYPALPFASLLAADVLACAMRTGGRSFKSWFGIQFSINVLIWLAVGGIFWWIFPPSEHLGLIPFLLLFLAASMYFSFRGKTAFDRLLMPTVLTMLGATIFMNVHYYSELLSYQSGQEAAYWLRDKGVDPKSVYSAKAGEVRAGEQAWDFYMQRIVPDIGGPELLAGKFAGDSVWVFSDQSTVDSLEKAGVIFADFHYFPAYHVTMVTPRFLNPSTREQELTPNYLILIRREDLPGAILEN